MNDSNQSLRFSRSYQEATGKMLHSRDFYEPEPLITGKEALFWLCGAICLGIIVYIIKGF
jgi:hypothetical protein